MNTQLLKKFTGTDKLQHVHSNGTEWIATDRHVGIIVTRKNTATTNVPYFLDNGELDTNDLAGKIKALFPESQNTGDPITIAELHLFSNLTSYYDGTGIDIVNFNEDGNIITDYGTFTPSCKNAHLKQIAFNHKYIKTIATFLDKMKIETAHLYKLSPHPSAMLFIYAETAEYSIEMILAPVRQTAPRKERTA